MTCPCGGVLSEHRDSLACECGGYVQTQTWSDYHCDRCGRGVGEAMDFDHEMLNEHAMDFADEPLYHKGCGGTVTVKNHSERRHAYGWDPPEQVVTCSKCGEIGYEEAAEHLDEEDETESGTTDDDSLF